MLFGSFFVFLLTAAAAGAQTIVTMAGLPHSHREAVDGKPALSAPLGSVYGLAMDRTTGRLLFHDQGLVHRIEADGSLLTLAGMGRDPDGDTVDGTPASGLRFGILRGMAQDASGILYLADATLGRVFRVEADGTVKTFAGGGTAEPGAASDGGPATAARLSSPRGIVFDSKGNLDIADLSCLCIRQVSPVGTITTVYTLPPSRDLRYFEGLAIDAQDNLYATEFVGHVVMKIGRDGTAAIVAGTGTAGFSGDGGKATDAQLGFPSGVTVDGGGNLFIADTANHRVRRVAADGTITTIAGTGDRGFAGDGGPATNAQLQFPAQTLLDGAGNLYIAEFDNRRVRRVAADGTISTVAGSGVADEEPDPLQAGDGGPALRARFSFTTAALFGPSGDLYIAEFGGSRVRRISPDGTIHSFAGTGENGYAGDGGPAVQARLDNPVALAADSRGTIYIATAGSRVRKVTPDGIISLVAGAGPGSGPVRSQGDGGPAVQATLNEPKGVAVDTAGNVYIADTSNARLRKVDSAGIITTVAGPGNQGTDYWNSVVLDPQGNVYVAITHVTPVLPYTVIDRLNPDGTRTRVAGNAQPCDGAGPQGEFAQDGAKATDVRLCVVVGMTFDAQGTMYIPESRYGAVLRLSKDGTISRVAGSALAQALGDGGPPLAANLGLSGAGSPALAVDTAGDLWIPATSRVRKTMAAPVKITLPASLSWQGTQADVVHAVMSVGEPFPYLARTRTDDGGTWLRVNRTSGITGDALRVSGDAAGLAPGVYRGTVTVTANGTSADLRVTMEVK